MKKFTTIRLALLAAVLVAAHGASAATLTVNGEISTQTCALSVGTATQTITLPTVGPSDLLNANNLSPVTFRFALSGCDPTYNNAAVTIGGTTAASDVAGFTNVIANTGTATNVGIGFVGATSVSSYPAGPLSVGTKSANAALNGTTTKSANIYLRAQIVPLVQATTAAAGTVVGTATATFTYA